MESKNYPSQELQLFTAHLKYIREHLGWLQRDLRDRTGLNLSYISDLERQRVNVGIDRMARIAQALNIPLYRMLDASFIQDYDLKTNSEWTEYQPLIDNSYDIPFERKVFAENFRQVRMHQGHTLKEMVKQTEKSPAFLISFERGATSISLENAIHLAHFVKIPLRILFIPKPSTLTTQTVQAESTNPTP